MTEMTTTTSRHVAEPELEHQAEAQGEKPAAVTDLFGLSRDFPSGFLPLTPEQQRVFAHALAEAFGSPLLEILAAPPAEPAEQGDATRADDLEAAGRLLADLGRRRLEAIHRSIGDVLAADEPAPAPEPVATATAPGRQTGNGQARQRVRRRTKAELRKLH
jgi:hypothetical protein